MQIAVLQDLILEPEALQLDRFLRLLTGNNFAKQSLPLITE